MKTLLIGCGTFKHRQLQYDDRQDFSNCDVTTIDMDPNCNPTIVMSMDGLGQRSLRHPFGKKLPFKSETFDELVAYNCLEHWGMQGDWKGYFQEFGEYHRVLKQGGHFSIIVPRLSDYFADPGHTRFFTSNHFGFLNQKFYEENKRETTCFTDYRHFWKKNFDIYNISQNDSHYGAVLIKT